MEYIFILSLFKNWTEISFIFAKTSKLKWTKINKKFTVFLVYIK